MKLFNYNWGKAYIWVPTYTNSPKYSYKKLKYMIHKKLKLLRYIIADKNQGQLSMQQCHNFSTQRKTALSKPFYK